MRVVGYIRVSTAEQGDSGLGLEAQRHVIETEAERRGWALVDVREDVASGKRADNRPGLQRALAACRGNGKREADALVVAKLDRLSRSLLDFADIVHRAKREGWQLIVLDQGFDMTTPNGRAMAGMLAVFAEWERETIAARTSAAMMAKKRAGWNPPQHRHKVPMTSRHRRRIAELHAAGESIRAIARKLDRHPETVRRALATVTLET